MKYSQNLILSSLLLSISFVAEADSRAAQTHIDATQKQIDAAQQHRQQQYQQSQAEKFQPKADVRLETQITDTLTLSNHELPCYPIHQITLIDYSPDNSLTTSQFQ